MPPAPVLFCSVLSLSEHRLALLRVDGILLILLEQSYCMLLLVPVPATYTDPNVYSKLEVLRPLLRV